MRHPAHRRDQALRSATRRLRDALDEFPPELDEDTGEVTVYASHCREITPGIVDGDAVSWLKYGNCAMLAVLVHQRTGWPLVMVSTDDKTEGASMNDTRMVHVLCRQPDGRLRDIEGAHQPDDALADWQGRHPACYLEDVTEQALMDLVCDEPPEEFYGELELAIIDDFAARIAAADDA